MNEEINKTSYTKICLIGDTHSQENKLSLPNCDILIHTGDFGITNMSQLNHADKWFKNQKGIIKIFSPGNHDIFCEKIGKQKCKKYFKNVLYVENEELRIKNLKLYFSPNTPFFNNWAFMYERYSEEAKNIWKQIPENLDFLITHAPPYRILDQNFYMEHCGCEVLQREVLKKEPKFHCFGHIHGSYGKKTINNTTFLNCSVLDEDYKLTNKPTIIEI